MSMLANIGVGAALIAAMVNIPLLAASVLSGAAVDGGLLLLRMTLLIPPGAVLGGILADRIGYRWLTAAGLLFAAAGLWLMSGWALDTPDLERTLHLALAGFGFGVVIAPITSTALQWVRRDEAALGAALVNTARMVGMMIGLSALSAWGLELFKSLMASHPAPLPGLGETTEEFNRRLEEYNQILAQNTLTVYTVGFAAAAVVCILSIAPALFLRRPPGVSDE
jgi:hypothetical protein